MLKIAEHVHEVENGKLGWREPKSDGRKGGGVGKTDIYLSQIGGELFGYAAPDRGQASKQHPMPRRLHGYLVLDNDYSAFEFPGTSAADDLEVTLAHEYNHILQFGYDAFQDAWFAESTATWMEDQVYPHIDDYLRYVRRWVKRWDTPLTTSSIKEYGSAVWNHVAGTPLRRLDRAPGLGAGDPRAPGRLLRQRLRIGDPRRSGPPTSATTSPASPPPSPSGARARSSARAGSIRTCRGRGACRSTGSR